MADPICRKGTPLKKRTQFPESVTLFPEIGSQFPEKKVCQNNVPHSGTRPLIRETKFHIREAGTLSFCNLFQKQGPLKKSLSL